MKRYMITIRVNAPLTGWHFDHKDAILREEDGHPVEWVEKDNKGIGYAIEEAHKALDGVVGDYWLCCSRLSDISKWDDSDIEELKEEIDKDPYSFSKKFRPLNWYKGEGYYLESQHNSPKLIYRRGDDALRVDGMTIEIVEFVTYATNDIVKAVIHAYLDAESNDPQGLAECLDWIRWHNEEGRLRAITKGLYPWLDIVAENLERYE